MYLLILHFTYCYLFKTTIHKEVQLAMHFRYELHHGHTPVMQVSPGIQESVSKNVFAVLINFLQMTAP